MRFTHGWVKLNREVVARIGSHFDAKSVWLSLLTMASRFEFEAMSEGKVTQFAPGTVLTSYQELAGSASSTKISRAKRGLLYLKALGLVTIHSTKRGQMICISGWEDQQELEPQEDQKTPENTHKKCQTNANEMPTTCQDFAPSGEIVSTQNHNGNLIYFKPVKKSCQTNANEMPMSCHLNGEREKEENKYIHTPLGKSRKPRKQYSEEFEKIYSEYPRQEGKTRGYKTFQKEILSETDLNQLAAAVSNYRRAKVDCEYQFLMHFGTFMNQWTDWVDPPQAKPHRQVQTLSVEQILGKTS
jgi:hypothetical protein